MSRGLHLRGRAHALHPPGRVCRLRRVRTGVPGGSDLLRGRRPGPVEGLLQGERRVLRRPRLTRWRVEGRQDRQGPRAGGCPATAGTRRELSQLGRLPTFPWDTIADEAATAAAHPDGIVDLSVGTPVDPTPAVIRAALTGAADAPGYPFTSGTAELRAAAARMLERRHGAVGLTPQAV